MIPSFGDATAAARRIQSARVSAWLDAVPGRSERLAAARWRARGRENLQRMGLTEAALDEGPYKTDLESAGHVLRPDEQLPYERVHLQSRGRDVARMLGLAPKPRDFVFRTTAELAQRESS